MIKNIFLILLPVIFLPLLISCSKDTKDTSELYEKSQTRGAIIERSGTIFRDEDMAWKDAQNRIQTGGGLLGKKPGKIDFLESDSKKSEQTYSSAGLPINPYLWKGSLETISFMPLASADPFSGIIITDWYSSDEEQNQRCKLNIFIKGVDLKTDNLKVNSFCQTLADNGNWIDMKLKEENNTKLENAILNKAKKILLSQS